jgi:hypothetical protein
MFGCGRCQQESYGLTTAFPASSLSSPSRPSAGASCCSFFRVHFRKGGAEMMHVRGEREQARERDNTEGGGGGDRKVGGWGGGCSGGVEGRERCRAEQQQQQQPGALPPSFSSTRLLALQPCSKNKRRGQAGARRATTRQHGEGRHQRSTERAPH